MIFSRDFGNPANPRVVVMHGLCGSSRNWLSVGEALAGQGLCVTLLDARDHGMSEWSDELSYQALAQDFMQWWSANNSPEITFVGHSMWGKLGMVLATHYGDILGDRLKGLCVVDIAPKDYSPHYQDSLRACLELDLDKIDSRKAADEALGERIENTIFRQFLLSNLYSDSDGNWAWRCNFELILRDLPNLAANPLKSNDISDKSILFVAGEKSNFIEPADESLLKAHFPHSQLAWLPTGHNVHIEAREAFVKILSSWIKSLK